MVLHYVMLKALFFPLIIYTNGFLYIFPQDAFFIDILAQAKKDPTTGNRTKIRKKNNIIKMKKSSFQ